MKALILLLLLFYNLTYFGIHRWNGGALKQQEIWDSGIENTGSINVFSNHIKLKVFLFTGNSKLTGNINSFSNIQKISDVVITTNINGAGYSEYNNTRISGNISVFTDKYNMSEFHMVGYPYIIGEVKNLKNLKKLFWFYAAGCSITGSKADLWNGGANVTTFAI